MTVNKLYLEINCEFNHSSIVLNQIPLFVRDHVQNTCEVSKELI